jgi:hypothetical protein
MATLTTASDIHKYNAIAKDVYLRKVVSALCGMIAATVQEGDELGALRDLARSGHLGQSGRILCGANLRGNRARVESLYASRLTYWRRHTRNVDGAARAQTSYSVHPHLTAGIALVVERGRLQLGVTPPPPLRLPQRLVCGESWEPLPQGSKRPCDDDIKKYLVCRSHLRALAVSQELARIGRDCDAAAACAHAEWGPVHAAYDATLQINGTHPYQSALGVLDTFEASTRATLAAEKLKADICAVEVVRDDIRAAAEDHEREIGRLVAKARSLLVVHTTNARLRVYITTLASTAL